MAIPKRPRSIRHPIPSESMAIARPRSAPAVEDPARSAVGFGRWEGLHKDLLLLIFRRLEPLFLLSTVAWVCRTWGRVCYDRFFGSGGENTLDFGRLERKPFAETFMSEDGKPRLMKLLHGVMAAYGGDTEDHNGVRATQVAKIAFPFGDLVVSDDLLCFIAERSPRLRELYLPCGREISHKGFARVICYWNGIEKISIVAFPFHHNFEVYRIIEAVGINCKNLEILCLFGCCLNQQLSPEIAQNLKGLKQLRLERLHIAKVGLKNILSKCKKLQKVKIWHCLNDGNDSDLLASCEIQRIKVDGVMKWSLGRNAEAHDLKNLLNLLWK